MAKTTTREGLVILVTMIEGLTQSGDLYNQVEYLKKEIGEKTENEFINEARALHLSIIIPQDWNTDKDLAVVGVIAPENPKKTRSKFTTTDVLALSKATAIKSLAYFINEAAKSKQEDKPNFYAQNIEVLKEACSIVIAVASWCYVQDNP